MNPYGYAHKRETMTATSARHVHEDEVTPAARVPRASYAWATLRLSLGGIFFWAFLDKLFGLGFATKPENAWIQGGSPTSGFLNFGTEGPFQSFYQSIAGNAFVDALFMTGLLLIGLALLSGIGVRIAGYSGAFMVLLMWAAHLPPENNPILDDHMVYAVALIGLALSQAGRTWGFGNWWAKQPVVQRYPILE